MKIIYGISDGAVLQRNKDNVAWVKIKAEYIGEFRTDIGCVIPSDGGFTLTGIPVGGPYTVTVSDEESSVTFDGIYVGDVWLLAGQSNMEGAGRMTAEDYETVNNPEQAVRAFYMDDSWRPAVPGLHQTWLSKDEAHRSFCQRIYGNNEIQSQDSRQVGPGYFFAKEMYDETGVPQGVIPCAIGGASIYEWQPSKNGEDTYLTASIRRIRDCGGNIKGMFWYQGESEAYPEGAKIYPQLFDNMLKELKPYGIYGKLPTVQVQINSHSLNGCTSDGAKRGWTVFRDMQNGMKDIFPDLETVASNDLDRDDLIHLSSDSHKKLGKRAVYAMRHIIEEKGLDEPKAVKVYAEPDDVIPSWSLIHIRYENVAGALKSEGRPFGFMLAHGDDEPSMTYIQRIMLSRNEVLVRAELSTDALREYRISYGWGMDTYCNITDGEGRAIPSYGALDIE